MAAYGELETLLASILSREQGRGLTEEELVFLHEVVSDHGLDAPNDNANVLEIIRSLDRGICSPHPLRLPTGYPNGSSGLENVFLDLRERFDVDWRSDGETVTATFPVLGRVLRVWLEGDVYAILPPMSFEQLADWMRVARARHQS